MLRPAAGQDDKRTLAQQAGVPAQYWDDVWVSTDGNGSVNIYFGGIGEPAGDGHGHYAMDASGHVTYRRDPGEDHGAQNFTDFWEKLPNSEGWEKYTSSTDRDTGLPQTDFFAGTVGETDQRKKVHIAIDDNGDVTFVRDMDGTVLYDRKHGVGYLPPDLNWDR